MAKAEAQAVEEQQPDQGQELSGEQEVQETQEMQQEETVEASPLEDEVKKWQSMYDKAQADNTKMQTALTDYLNSQKDAQQQPQQQVPQITEDEFNPWDAYYKPDSPSYKMRIQSESNLVHSVLDNEIQRLEGNMAMSNTRNELRQSHNMNDNDINEFMEFISQPKDSVPVSALVKLWRDTNGRNDRAPNVAIPQTKQQAPRTAGTQSNQGPTRKSDASKVWDQIMNSTGVTNRLP
jgi:hypothetical protein|tara:strand:- start:363 stop:1070 length:708 start_codon:yes stop_codon:yes gene_type:complete